MASFKRLVDRIKSSLGRRVSDWLFSAYNEGRQGGAEALGAEFGLVSAILDRRTCAYCRWVDNKLFQLPSRIAAPPFHDGCRCLVTFFTREDMVDDELTLDDFDLWGSGPPSSVYPPGRVY